MQDRGLCRANPMPIAVIAVIAVRLLCRPNAVVLICSCPKSFNPYPFGRVLYSHPSLHCKVPMSGPGFASIALQKSMYANLDYYYTTMLPVFLTNRTLTLRGQTPDLYFAPDIPIWENSPYPVRPSLQQMPWHLTSRILCRLCKWISVCLSLLNSRLPHQKREFLGTMRSLI